MSFQCQICSKVYKTKRGFDNHIKKGCQKKKQKIYHCNLCDIKFESNIELQRHMELDICSKFLRNNTYCYPCHQEFGTHELLVQHEFTDDHLNVVKEGYSSVTPLSEVKQNLKTILTEGSIQEEEVYLVTREENEIQEELFEMDELLRQKEKELEKEEQKEIRKQERAIKRQEKKLNKEKNLKKLLKKGIKVKSNSADISSFFNFTQQKPEKTIKLNMKVANNIKKPLVSINKENNKKHKKIKAEYDKQFNYEFANDDSDDEDYNEINMDKINNPIPEQNINDKNNKETKNQKEIKENKRKQHNNEIKHNEEINNIRLILEKDNVDDIDNVDDVDDIDNVDDVDDNETKKIIVVGHNIKKQKIQKKGKTQKNTSSEIKGIQPLNSITKITKKDTIKIEKEDSCNGGDHTKKSKQDIIESSKNDYMEKQIVQYNNYDRSEKRREFYRELREQRHNKELKPYIESFINDYDKIKKYIGSYNINSLNLYNKLMNRQPNQTLPYLHTPGESDKISQTEFKKQIDNIAAQRSEQDKMFLDRPQDVSLQPTVVSKTDRNEFGNDLSQRLKDRETQTKQILSDIPINNGIVAPGMALPQTETEKMSTSDFQKQVNQLMMQRGQENKFIKQAVDQQKVNDKPNFQESSGNNFMAGNESSSMEMNQFQKPNQTSQRDLCSVMGMFDGQPKNNPPKQQVTNINVSLNDVEVEDDLEKELKEVYQLERENKIQKSNQITTNQNYTNQNAALTNLLGEVQQNNQNNQNDNQNNNQPDNDFNLGNELQQVAMELQREPRPKRTPEQEAKMQTDFELFQKKAEQASKLEHAKQIDSTVRNPIWVIMQKIVNQPHMDRNMMNLLVNCRIEDYVIVHRYITNSNQMMIETNKKQGLIKIFNNFVKFLTKKKKAGELIVQGKNVKYMLDTLRKLKF